MPNERATPMRGNMVRKAAGATERGNENRI